MGSALLRGWLARGVPARAVTVIDPHPTPDLLALTAETGVTLNPPGAGTADVLLVAVKPQMIEEAAHKARAWLTADSLVISIMAGKTLADLQALFPFTNSHVRAMPNLPAAVRRGVTVAVAARATSSWGLQRADQLLSAVGTLEWLQNEALMDAATAVSGSGPAYVFYLVECLTQAGREAGLPPEVAERLSRATIEGAGEILRTTGRAVVELREDVTSPGGTTQAGMSVLMNDNKLQSLLSATVQAVATRARELGGTAPTPHPPV